MSKLRLIDKGDDFVTFQREFSAPPAAIFDAHTDAALMQKWLLGPDGWSMPICVSDLKPDGLLHCVWVQNEGSECFSLTGHYVEIDAPNRIIHVERMHLPNGNSPDNRVETTFAANGAGTTLTLRMQIAAQGKLEDMLASGMEAGMEASYRRLDAQFAPKGHS